MHESMALTKYLLPGQCSDSQCLGGGGGWGEKDVHHYPLSIKYPEKVAFSCPLSIPGVGPGLGEQ